jgi:hypothetical protein
MSRSGRCHGTSRRQQFGIELKALALTGERAEQIDTRRMVEQQVWFSIANELRRSRYLAVRDFDPGNIAVHVMVMMEVPLRHAHGLRP